MSLFSFKQFALLPALLLVCSTIVSAQECTINYTSADFSHRNPCKPFIGVGTSSVAAGLNVDYTVDNTPATQYGILAGDVILTLDGVAVRSQPELMRERDKHQQGEAFTLTILRDGVEKTIKARFYECSTEDQQKMETMMVEKEIRMAEMEMRMQEKFKSMEMNIRPILGVLSADRAYYSHRSERDPCQVFIGVYTSDNALEGRGTRVDGVIDDTPAKLSGVQPGDIIIAFNGVPVNTYGELTFERDKNKAGDGFRMTVLRAGVKMKIDARFKSCDSKRDAKLEEKVEVPAENTQRETPQNFDNTLNLEVFEAFPSPTFGTVNIQFEAEAVPTTVRILDISGRAVYQKDLPKFGGSFTEQVNLSANKAGNYVLSIQQGDKVQSKQIVLLPRA